MFEFLRRVIIINNLLILRKVCFTAFVMRDIYFYLSMVNPVLSFGNIGICCSYFHNRPLLHFRQNTFFSSAVDMDVGNLLFSGLCSSLVRHFLSLTPVASLVQILILKRNGWILSSPSTRKKNLEVRVVIV